jgi:hypothetical protein
MFDKYYKTTHVILEYIDVLTTLLPLFIFLGLIYILVLERKAVLTIVKERNKLSDPKYCYRICLPVLRRIYYLVGGVILSIGGFFIITSIDRFIEQEMPNDTYPPYSERGNFILMTAGVAGVLAFLFAGISLIFSAGGRFLVNTAKFITLITIISLMVLLVLARAQLV